MIITMPVFHFAISIHVHVAVLLSSSRLVYYVLEPSCKLWHTLFSCYTSLSLGVRDAVADDTPMIIDTNTQVALTFITSDAISGSVQGITL
jgi:hypothetical protein